MSINLTPARKCKVVNQEDREYRPVPCPLEGNHKMLELCPPHEGYIFPSIHKAQNAIYWTTEYRKSKGETFNKSWLDDYVIFLVGK